MTKIATYSVAMNCLTFSLVWLPTLLVLGKQTTASPLNCSSSSTVNAISRIMATKTPDCPPPAESINSSLEYQIMAALFIVCFLILLVLMLNFAFELYREKVEAAASAAASGPLIIGDQAVEVHQHQHQQQQQQCYHSGIITSATVIIPVQNSKHSEVYRLQHWPELPPSSFIPVPLTTAVA